MNSTFKLMKYFSLMIFFPVCLHGEIFRISSADLATINNLKDHIQHNTVMDFAASSVKSFKQFAEQFGQQHLENPTIKTMEETGEDPNALNDRIDYMISLSSIHFSFLEYDEQEHPQHFRVTVVLGNSFDPSFVLSPKGLKAFYDHGLPKNKTTWPYGLLWNKLFTDYSQTPNHTYGSLYAVPH